MPKVANYFVRPEGVTLSASTVKDVQYGEGLMSQPSTLYVLPTWQVLGQDVA